MRSLVIDVGAEIGMEYKGLGLFLLYCTYNRLGCILFGLEKPVPGTQGYFGFN
jgi:hypothetical protein